jgi:hypothetical protein
LCGSQKTKVTTEKNKRGHIPAHDKNPDGNANNRRPQSIYISHVFRRQKKRFSAKRFHESTANRCKQSNPENQEYLVFAKMQKKQLYGQGIKRTPQVVKKGDLLSQGL